MRWQKRHGRHNLPWQKSRDPYAIWVAEIMLQQTQVSTVIPYYERFMKRFPTLGHLGRARAKTVLLHFAGLGYYARARNLHQAARQLVREGRGIPDRFHELVALPGIGRSTAGAILAFACGAPYPILDGNVRRLFTRFFEGQNPIRSSEETRRLWTLAEELVPRDGVAAYTQGLMDLGASVCTPRVPHCEACPLEPDCRFTRVTPGPSARPNRHRRLPRRHLMRLLILEHQNRIYLVERPARGIWGGLHCPPEIDAGEDPTAWIATHLHASVATLTALPTVLHTLTHLELLIEPHRAILKHVPDTSSDLPGGWISRRKLARAPLPAPIARLLQ